MIIKVAASGYLLRLPFGATGTIGPHDAECTLEIQLQEHWMALELLVGDGPGIENHAQLLFGMLLIAFPSQGYYATPPIILNGWLMRLIEIFDVFCG